MFSLLKHVRSGEVLSGSPSPIDRSRRECFLGSGWIRANRGGGGGGIKLFGVRLVVRLRPGLRQNAGLLLSMRTTCPEHWLFEGCTILSVAGMVDSLHEK